MTAAEQSTIIDFDGRDAIRAIERLEELLTPSRRRELAKLTERAPLFDLVVDGYVMMLRPSRELQAKIEEWR